MKPEELYNREPEKIVNPFEVERDYMSSYFYGWRYNHLSELENWIDMDNILNIYTSDKVTIKVYKDFRFDYRRFWRLCSVWFEEKPVMIIQNAGREGDDYVKRYITNKIDYIKMIYHIRSLIETIIDLDTMDNDMIDESSDVSTLDNFYGNSLDGYFDIFF